MAGSQAQPTEEGGCQRASMAASKAMRSIPQVTVSTGDALVSGAFTRHLPRLHDRQEPHGLRRRDEVVPVGAVELDQPLEPGGGLIHGSGEGRLP